MSHSRFLRTSGPDPKPSCERDLLESTDAQLIAELRENETRIQRAAVLPDHEGLTSLIQLASRRLRLLHELRRRRDPHGTRPPPAA
jgi:hypothetical protein